MMRRIDVIMRGGQPSLVDEGERPAIGNGAAPWPDDAGAGLIDRDAGPAAHAVRGRAAARPGRVLAIASSLAAAAFVVGAVLNFGSRPTREPVRRADAVVQTLPPVVVAPDPPVAVPDPPAPVTTRFGRRPAIAGPRPQPAHARLAATVRRPPARPPTIARIMAPAPAPARRDAAAEVAATAGERTPVEIQTPHLTGEAKRRALADDAILTRRLNHQSLARGGLVADQELTPAGEPSRRRAER